MANKTIDPTEFFALWIVNSDSYHVQLSSLGICNCQTLIDTQTAKLFPGRQDRAINCVISVSAINETVLVI